MADALDDLTRLALLEEWDHRCVWCRRPIFFNEMEVEHLIPKSLSKADKAEARAKALHHHGLPEDYDLFSLANLAPSCRLCNGGKGLKPPPEAPAVTLILERARDRAPGIRETASRMSTDRAVRRAATVLRQNAEAGHPLAIQAIQDAAEVVSTAFTSTTGRSVSRLHTALEQVAGIGGLLVESDAHFDYLPSAGRTGGPAPQPADGTVMSYSEVSGTVTSRLDVVPRHPSALDEYGPRVKLTAGEGEAGERALKLLNDALIEGREVEIVEGLDVTFERMPPLFDDRAGKPMSGGTVRLTPTGPAKKPVPDWDARFRINDSVLRVKLSQQPQAPDGWDDVLAGRSRGLLVTALLRKSQKGGEIRFNMKHAPDDSPVREQLGGLRFLEAMARGGEMVVTDGSKARRPPLKMQRAATAVPQDALALMALMEDLVLIEGETGARFQLPDGLRIDELRHIASVADLLRRREREVTWHDATLTVADTALEEVRTGGKLRVEHRASTVVLGLDLDLGTIRRDLPAYEVTSIGGKDEATGAVTITIVPPDDASAAITEVLIRPIRTPRKQQGNKRPTQKKRRKKGRRR